MGLDAFLEIHTWKSHQDLLEEIAFIVIARPDHNYTDAQQGWRIIDTYLKSTLSSDSQFDAERACYTLEGKQPVYVCDIKALDISSTNIREMIKKKQSIENLLPPEVADYIRLKGLYK
jgi:nicotinate-nucleotide adenylyltransferase